MTTVPWNDSMMRQRLLSVTAALPRTPLAEIEPPKEPGVYLQFLATPDHRFDDRRRLVPGLRAVFGTAVATGILPCYAGVATVDLSERIGRYRKSLAGITAIDEHSLYIAVLPMPSAASALFAERALIDAYDPVLNGTGWGSKVPGGGRPGRRSSPIDALISGREWASKISEPDRALAHARVVAKLARRGNDAPRWPALCSARDAAHDVAATSSAEGDDDRRTLLRVLPPLPGQEGCGSSTTLAC